MIRDLDVGLEMQLSPLSVFYTPSLRKNLSMLCGITEGMFIGSEAMLGRGSQRLSESRGSAASSVH